MTTKKITVYWRSDNRTLIVTGNDNNDLVGTAIIDYPKDDPDVAWFWNFQIKPVFRGKGVGKEIMTAAIEDAKANHCTTIKLNYDWRDSPKWVREWYERLGFKEEGFDNQGVVTMKKELK